MPQAVKDDLYWKLDRLNLLLWERRRALRTPEARKDVLDALDATEQEVREEMDSYISNTQSLGCCEGT